LDAKNPHQGVIIASEFTINGEEHGGGVFPPGGWADAMSEGKSWISHSEGKDDAPVGA
jgi:hypothetical protein